MRKKDHTGSREPEEENEGGHQIARIFSRARRIDSSTQQHKSTPTPPSPHLHHVDKSNPQPQHQHNSGDEGSVSDGGPSYASHLSVSHAMRSSSSPNNSEGSKLDRMFSSLRRKSFGNKTPRPNIMFPTTDQSTTDARPSNEHGENILPLADSHPGSSSHSGNITRSKTMGNSSIRTPKFRLLRAVNDHNAGETMTQKRAVTEHLTSNSQEAIGEIYMGVGLGETASHSSSSSVLDPGGDRLEKLLKRAKPFFDERQKHRARLASLWNFIHASNALDQANFFLEHAERIFNVIHNTFIHQVEKIKKGKDRPTSFTSKDMIQLSRCLFLLRKVFIYCPELIRTGWQSESITSMLVHILDHGNHPNLRAQGFRLLLLWLNCQMAESKPTMHLFANALPLNLFLNDSSTHNSTIDSSSLHDGKCRLGQVPIHADDRLPLFPNPNPPSYQDTIQLLEIFSENLVRLAHVAAGSEPPAEHLDFTDTDGLETDNGVPISYGLDAAFATAKFMLSILRKYYLVKFFPACARRLHIEGVSEDKDFGFPSCPPKILRALMTFLIRYCIDPPPKSPPNPHVQVSPVTPILKSILFSSSEHREIMHDLLRQCLKLPAGHPMYKDIVKSAVHVIGVLVLSKEEERPAFLRKTRLKLGGSSTSLKSERSAVISPTSTTSHLHSTPTSFTDTAQPCPNPLATSSTKPSSSYSQANMFLRSYFSMLLHAFEEHPLDSLIDTPGVEPLSTDMDVQVQTYKDILNLFRAVVVYSGIELEDETWESMLSCLLFIHNQIYTQIVASNIPMRDITTGIVDDLMDFSIETLLHGFARSPCKCEKLWAQLRELLAAQTEWAKLITHWSQVVMNLTKILSGHLYGVDAEEARVAAAVQCRKSYSTIGRNVQIISKKRHRHARLHHSDISNFNLSDELMSGIGSGLEIVSGGNSSSSNNGDRAEMPRRPVSMMARNEISSAYASVDPRIYSPSGLAVRADMPNTTTANHRISRHGDLPEAMGGEHGSNRHSASINTIPGIPLTPSALPNAGSGLASESDKRLEKYLTPFLSSLCCVEFTQLSNAFMDGESVLWTWKNMICSLGNPNDILNPGNHALAIQGVVDVLDLLAAVRARQAFDAPLQPPFHELLPWLLQAVEQDPSVYAVGRASAYGCLCRIICRRDLISSEFNSMYAPFYRAVSNGLLTAESDRNVFYAIIRNGAEIFTLNLPGCNILLPTYLDAIGQILSRDRENLVSKGKGEKLSDHIRGQCIDVLCSLVSLSQYWENTPLYSAGIGVENERSSSNFLQLKYSLKDLFIALVKAETSHSIKEASEAYRDTHLKLLCGICILAIEEMTHATSNADSKLIRECLTAVMEHLYWDILSVVEVATDCISTLVQAYRPEYDPEASIAQVVFTYLLEALHWHLNSHRNSQRKRSGPIISKLFGCLLEWLMAVEPQFFNSTELSRVVLEVIDNALHVGSDQLQTAGGSTTGAEKLLPPPPPTPPPSTESSSSSLLAGTSLATIGTMRPKDIRTAFNFALKRIQANGSQSENSSATSGNENSEAEEHSSDENLIHGSAENILLHLLHHHNHFGVPFGPVVMDTTIYGSSIGEKQNEDIDEPFQYFAFNDTMLLAFSERMESTASGYKKARVIMRDVTGRYAWDAQSFYCTLSKMNLEEGKKKGKTQSNSNAMLIPDFDDGELHTQMRDKLVVRKGLSIEQAPKEFKMENPTYPRESNELPLWQPDGKTDGVDMLTELLKYVKETQIALAPGNETQSANMVSSEASTYSYVRKELERHILEERHQHDIRTTSTSKTERVPINSFLPSAFAMGEQPMSPYQQCRLLLSHLGFLNHDVLKDRSFHLLAKSPGLYRDIKGLDKKRGREAIKIGVLYIGPGQDSEQAILQNMQASNMYNEFVASLGWEVDITTHTGYLGGLERNLTNGSKATYYCTSTIEMIFHDVTKMPTDPHDNKQVKKKRHIGNDHVHIVWNEHQRDYRVETIGGDFGNVQIIITPLPNGLFSIRVYRDAGIPFFGPLLNGMVISRALLGPLVRATAIHGHRATIHTTHTRHRSMYAHRAADIHTIVNRHKGAKWTYEQFMQHVLQTQ
ncbi:uncharacterized protein VTP21DRAFT_4693 [Calcarisporiella thermophila]|uniref:uncharacterized protein n=1 Tax=Calcarisporiella thermophila TaxID=911321 RepID=UPI003742BD44